MASSRNNANGLSTALLILILFATFLSSEPAELEFSSYDESLKQRKLVLGSRPPRCVNKCLSCRPCMATLVIPPHQRRDFRTSSQEENGSYYLLSWKCRCGNKLFKP
ncbi:PREDICTED: EPIDERMAL PATTERNING FACTOR-like protein 8 [Nelumbo nucifera]|uniref:Epidermal patterning factor-like protein n=2 Tax=Nelumbo nucifera TaxID=4432 RepID=A0A822XZU3_NELNU|nr:PREDICTED: EPIDERMAL PATTERNING FACTOR-like protein 8 [Nelumbo nucifera]DAD27174.1 TPA_asm: hypothetical protein HUJ06_028642 [Nelumbo nucifera]